MVLVYIFVILLNCSVYFGMKEDMGPFKVHMSLLSLAGTQHIVTGNVISPYARYKEIQVKLI